MGALFFGKNMNKGFKAYLAKKKGVKSSGGKKIIPKITKQKNQGGMKKVVLKGTKNNKPAINKKIERAANEMRNR